MNRQLTLTLHALATRFGAMSRLITWLVALTFVMPGTMLAQFAEQDEVEKRIEHDKRERDEERHHEEEEEEKEFEKNETELLTFVSKHIPAINRKLRFLKDRDHDDYVDHLRHIAEAMEHYGHMRREEPTQAEAFLAALKLESECQGLAHTINTMEGAAQKEELKKQLRAKLAKTFDMKMKERERELNELKAEVAEREALLEKRSRNRNRIIDRRMFELTTGDDEDLGW